jgi:hypothetical protein
MRRPALLCAAGAVLLSFGNVWFAAPAALCALAAAAVGPAPGEPQLPPRLVFGFCFLRGLFWLWFEQTLTSGARLEGFHGLALVAFVGGSAYLCVHLRASLEKARFWALLVVFVALAAAIGAGWLAVLALLVAAWAVARAGQTGELAALALLYETRTWHLMSRASVAPAALALVALALLALRRFSGLAARGTALLAALCIGYAVWSGHIFDGSWFASGLLCAAAALYTRTPGAATVSRR